MTSHIWNLLHCAVTLLLAGIAAYTISKHSAKKKNEEKLRLENAELSLENKILKQKIADYERSIQLPYNQEIEELPTRESLLLEHLKETVENNYTDPEFGVEKLALTLNISRSYLNRKMRELLHTTTNNYIREIRIEKAEELLRTSSLQINEICRKVGFQTPSYFIKCFKQRYGKSPNEYANSRAGRPRTILQKEQE